MKRLFALIPMEILLAPAGVDIRGEKQINFYLLIQLFFDISDHLDLLAKSKVAPTHTHFFKKLSF